MFNKLLFFKFFKFGLVGFSGIIVDYGITYLCKEKLKFNKYIANSVGFTIAASSNYLLNRLWTFHSHKAISTEYLKFFIVSLIGLGISNFIILVLLKLFPINFYFAKLVAIVTVVIWNFEVNYFYTFNAN
jgi:putative flippase GtrA